MENKVFCIIYGGPARNGNTYIPYKAIAKTAEEAIAVINTWKAYGGKRDGALPIKVNAVTEQKIRELFRDGLGTNAIGGPCTCVTMRTTGCGAWDISFYPALADTIEEHVRIYNEQREAARRERMRLAEEMKQRRMGELYEQRRGWYHVELDLKLMVFARRGNDYFADVTFGGDVIADSGMDAYDKAVQYVKDHPEELEHRGNMAVLQSWAEAAGSGYLFQFLGVKTDDGYSVDKWNEWKENGEI